MRVLRISLMALAITAACSRAGHAETAVVGTGSAFAAPIYTKWAEQEKPSVGIELNYQPSGSSVGQIQVLKGLTDFGASDVPMEDHKLKEADILQFPTVVGGYAVVVNLPGVASGQLRLDGAVLADIFMGDIKLWDDARIANSTPVSPCRNSLSRCSITRGDPEGLTQYRAFWRSTATFGVTRWESV